MDHRWLLTEAITPTVYFHASDMGQYCRTRGCKYMMFWFHAVVMVFQSNTMLKWFIYQPFQYSRAVRDYNSSIKFIIVSSLFQPHSFDKLSDFLCVRHLSPCSSVTLGESGCFLYKQRGTPPPLFPQKIKACQSFQLVSLVSTGQSSQEGIPECALHSCAPTATAAAVSAHYKT